MSRLRSLLLAGSILAVFNGDAAAQIQGPTSSQTPYYLPSLPGLTTTSLLTVSDLVNRPNGTPYRGMAGIPDGLGVFSNGDGTATILMNHELQVGTGVVRDHGQTGAFVSKYTVNTGTKAILNGEDLVKTVNVVTGTTQFGRLCSADLAPVSAYSFNGLGTTARLFMNGEEVGNEGRGFAHIATGPNTGSSFELPRLGKFSWENSVANPLAQNKTIVVGTDDSTPGQVYVYVGTKTNTGNDVDRAGLTNGNLYGVRVPGAPNEDRTTGVGGASVAFNLFNHGDVSGISGTTLNTNSNNNGVTNFLRPEDGHWDPNNPNQFYFVTTDRFDTVKDPLSAPPVGQVGRSRLWRMTFTDIANPENGGTLDMVLNGTGPYQMLDNMTVTNDGFVLMQEDPGNVRYSAKIWAYRIATGELFKVASADAARFGSTDNGTIINPTSPFTQDEESSGIIDVSDVFGPGSYLFDVQAHYGNGAEFVEGGQLLLLQGFGVAAVPEPSTFVLCGVSALGAGAYYWRARRKRRNRR